MTIINLKKEDSCKKIYSIRRQPKGMEHLLGTGRKKMHSEMRLVLEGRLLLIILGLFPKNTFRNGTAISKTPSSLTRSLITLLTAFKAIEEIKLLTRRTGSMGDPQIQLTRFQKWAAGRNYWKIKSISK